MGRAGQGRAGQGRAGQGRAGQGRAGQGRAGQGRAAQGSAGQGRAILAGKPSLVVPREVTMTYCLMPKSLDTFTSLIAASPSILEGAPKSRSLVSAAPMACTTYTRCKSSMNQASLGTMEDLCKDYSGEQDSADHMPCTTCSSKRRTGKFASIRNLC